jgi:hypothetical protein
VKYVSIIIIIIIIILLLLLLLLLDFYVVYGQSINEIVSSGKKTNHKLFLILRMSTSIYRELIALFMHKFQCKIGELTTNRRASLN